MQFDVLQSLPVQGGSPRNGKDPFKSDPAEFLNALAALLAPNTQPQPINDQPNFPNGNLAASGITMLSMDQPGVNTANMTVQDGQQGPETMGFTETLMLQSQGADQRWAEDLAAQGKVSLGNNGQLNEENRIFNSFEPALQATDAELSESRDAAREQQPETPEIKLDSEKGERYSLLADDIIPNDNEAMQTTQLTAAEKQLVNTATATKGNASQEWSQDWQGEQEMTTLEENSASERTATHQEIRSFAEQLAESILPGRENKAMQATEFRVARQELAQDLPRIIESQLRDSAGQEIKRDITIYLEPKDLGKLTVKVTAQDGIISVRILAEQTETRNLVEAGLANLRQSFSEQGIKYGRMEVELGGQNLYQQQYSQHQQSQQQQNPLYWNRPGSWQGKQWKEFLYQEEDRTAVEIRLNPNAAVDYRV